MKTLQEIETDLRGVQEFLSEAEGQFAAERALYGDAGPGQGAVIADARREMETLYGEQLRHPDYTEPAYVNVAVSVNEVPF